VQASELFDDEEQEKRSGPARAEEVLQVLPETYSAQRSEIDGPASQAGT
jgi:hypothetical protein